MNFKLCWLFYLLVIGVNGQGIYWECIRDQEDIQSQNNWYQPPETLYLETASELETELPGVSALDGTGIFYFEGTGGSQDLLTAMPTNFIYGQPTYMYLNYYGHIKNNDPAVAMVVVSDFDVANEQPVTTDLPRTANFSWGEALIPIEADVLSWFGIQISANNFDSGEFFLVDKIIVAQGAVMSMDEIKALCPEKDVPTTTTTTTERPPETSTAVSGFTCDRPGHFPDPHNCSMYHMCEYNVLGNLLDTICICPISTVWCQETAHCDNPMDCPCLISEIWFPEL